MSLPFGAAQPDLVGAFARGDQHVTQDSMYVLKEGLTLAIKGLERMLRAQEIAPASIDHFIPSVSSLRVARKLQRRCEEHLGLRSDVWRMNFTRVGYVGSVAVPIVLDEMARAGKLQPGDLVCTFAEESSKWMCAGTVFRWNP
jgi:3-oxoacyl-[acyl-carrier-protein] synthase III